MRKLVVLPIISVAMIVIISLFLMGGYIVNAEETYPCKVTEVVEGYGDLIYDLEEGNVGDIVTVTAKPYVFCKTDVVAVNGTALVAGEDGNYRFALVEGDNVISVKFVLDPEQMGALSTYIKQAQEGGIESLFTLNNLFNLLSWIFTALFGSGFIITLIRNKVVKQKTILNVTAEVKDTLNSELAKYFGDVFSPLVNAIDLKLTGVEEITKTLARCMVIAQENTPESRLAIIEELTKLQTSSTELAEQIKALIQEEVDKKEAEKAEKQETLKELEEANNSIQVEADTSKKEDYGQF